MSPATNPTAQATMAAPARTRPIVFHGMRRIGVGGFTSGMLGLSPFSREAFPPIVSSMWPIVREALSGASPPIRSQLRWVIALWCGLVLLQLWDSRNATGVAGVAEFLSAVLGVTGVALLGAAHTLQRTMDEAAARPRAREDADALQQVLLALPALGFASGVALGAAAGLMILRALLGTEWVLIVAAVTAYSAMLLFAGHTVTNSARTLFRHASNQAALAAGARSQAAAAQLAALQARMNPHFLFNALNTVASLVRSNPHAAECVVENLADVLRQTLRRSTGSMGTVDEEIEYVRAYLTLEQARWGSRLRVEWDVDEDARPRSLPPLVLQPLVENALAHGIGSRLTGGTIRISICAGDSLTIRVRDDGPGFPARWREGTGLGNLRERLHAIYGERASLDVASEADGAQVTVTLPGQASRA
jgi:signal transduction histidine kinase